MKNFYLLSAFLIITLLASCGSNYIPIGDSRYKLIDYDYLYMLDDVKVSKVEDLRTQEQMQKTDSIYFTQKLGYPNGLQDYLKISTNKLICKDTSIINFNPVNLKIKNFQLEKDIENKKDILQYEFEFLFEKEKKINSFTVKDSLSSDSRIEDEHLLIDFGIKKASNLFVLKYNDKLDSSLSVWTDKKIKTNKFDNDTISNLKINKKTRLSLKLGANHYYLNDLNGFGISISTNRNPFRVGKWKAPEIEMNFSLGYTQQYNYIKDANKYLWGITFDYEFLKYNNTKNPFLYYGVSIGMLLGSEIITQYPWNAIEGARLSIFTGVQLFESINVDVGLFAQKYFDPVYNPFSYGINTRIYFYYDLIY